MDAKGAAALILRALVLTSGTLVGILAFSALLGVGQHRHSQPAALSLTITTLVFGPPLLAAFHSRHERAAAFGGALFLWSLGILAGMPVFFPGERREALATGLTLLSWRAGDGDLGEWVAGLLPEEIPLAEPELPQATVAVAPEPPPRQARPDDLEADDLIELPYEGDGHKLSIEIFVEHGATSRELTMMLDTGATYTTLDEPTLATLGIRLSDSDPIVELHTANGVRKAHLLTLDKLWLGDLLLEGVTIAACNDCAGTETKGLLGLNVAGAFNVAISADDRMVTFTRRERGDRLLDIKPFSELSAKYTRYPGGRVEVEVELKNLGSRRIADATAAIRGCGQEWRIELGQVGPYDKAVEKMRLTDHPVCDGYEVLLQGASW